MAILINQDTTYLIQGITGKEGRRALTWMSKLGSKVVAGVTPGKGGQQVDGVKVYNSVAEAVETHPEINASCVYVPPKFVLSAVKAAVEAGIELVHVITENVPTQDTVKILELVEQKSAQLGKQLRVIGPSSIGVMSPGKSSMGSLGAGNQEGLVVPGVSSGVVVLSKSGGMALTMSQMIAKAGIAISTVVGLGGDKIAATTYADLLSDIQADDQSWGLVVVGEIGGSYEEDLAMELSKTKFSKAVVAFISGRFAQKLPAGVAFGHAGAIVSRKVGTREGKIKALKAAGVLIAESPEDIVELLEQVRVKVS